MKNMKWALISLCLSLFAMSWLFIGCGCDEEEPFAKQYAEIEYDPGSIAFADTPLAPEERADCQEAATVTLKLTAATTRSVEVKGVKIDGGGGVFAYKGVKTENDDGVFEYKSETPFSIEGGETVELVFLFTPDTEESTYNGSVEFETLEEVRWRLLGTEKEADPVNKFSIPMSGKSIEYEPPAIAVFTERTLETDPDLVIGVDCPSIPGIPFGGVTILSEATSTITIVNNGLSPLHLGTKAEEGQCVFQEPYIEFVESLSGSASVITIKNPDEIKNAILAQKETLEVIVSFKPTEASTAYAGDIVIYSDAYNCRTMNIADQEPSLDPVKVPVSGSGIEGQISISPTTIMFGDVAVGESAVETVRVENTGGDSFEFTGATITENPDLFSIDSIEPANPPYSLEGFGGDNNFATISVKFSPTEAGVQKGAMQIEADIEGSPFLVDFVGGSSGCLGVEPETWLSDVGPSESDEQAFTITNVTEGENCGTAPVIVQKINFDTTIGDIGGSFVLKDLPVLPLTLQPGEDSGFSVEYHNNPAISAEYEQTTVEIWYGDNTSDLSLAIVIVGSADMTENQRPLSIIEMINADPVKPVALPVEIAFDGSQSYDPEGELLTFIWTVESVPVNSDVNALWKDGLDNIPNPILILDNDTHDKLKARGAYTVGLVVKDPSGNESPKATKNFRIQPE